MDLLEITTLENEHAEQTSSKTAMKEASCAGKPRRTFKSVI